MFRPTDAWKIEAHLLLRRLEPSITSIMAYWKIPQMKVVIGGTPDIASLPNAQPPVLVLGKKWVEAGSDQERLKRVVHEVAGHMAYHLELGDEAREQGYFSDPERDTKSWEWFQEWRRGGKYE
mgnify:CR=1 FL=1